MTRPKMRRKPRETFLYQIQKETLSGRVKQAQPNKHRRDISIGAIEAVLWSADGSHVHSANFHMISNEHCGPCPASMTLRFCC
jgi:hypothetical protein